MTSPLPYLDRTRLAHGTRGKYVDGCRCEVCRSANTQRARDRELRALQAVADLPVVPGSICPGWDGVPCPKARKLRSDSTGVCAGCRMRAIWNGMVDAEPARLHLAHLSRRGVGTRAVHAACDVNRTTLTKITTGQRTQIRKSTLDAILSVDEDAIADHALIPSGPTRKLLHDLAPEYLTKKNLAVALGYRGYGIPARKKITARNAHRVRKLHRRIAG